MHETNQELENLLHHLSNLSGARPVLSGREARDWIGAVHRWRTSLVHLSVPEPDMPSPETGPAELHALAPDGFRLAPDGFRVLAANASGSASLQAK
jgi:hypothetical protein